MQAHSMSNPRQISRLPKHERMAVAAMAVLPKAPANLKFNTDGKMYRMATQRSSTGIPDYPYLATYFATELQKTHFRVYNPLTRKCVGDAFHFAADACEWMFDYRERTEGYRNSPSSIPPPSVTPYFIKEFDNP